MLPGPLKRLTYASTGLACLKVLDYLPLNKQKVNNQSLKSLLSQLKRHYGWQPEKYEALDVLSGVNKKAAIAT